MRGIARPGPASVRGGGGAGHTFRAWESTRENNESHTSTDAARHELSGAFSGDLIGPDDASYDAARTVYNAMIDRRPALIARCASAADVAATVDFAGATSCCSRSAAAATTAAAWARATTGSCVDLSRMNSVEVDAGARRCASAAARRGGGRRRDARARARDAVRDHLVDRRRRAHARRRHRLPLAQARADDRQPDRGRVVLADGEQVRASADENPELFWALRGGGGNFGVVTSFGFRCHPVSTVIAGPTFWPLEQTPGSCASTASSSRRAARPERLLRDDDRPTGRLPAAGAARAEGVRRGLVLHRRRRGPGGRLLAPALEVGTPLLHGAGPAPFPAVQSLFDGLYHAGAAVVLARGFRA